MTATTEISHPDWCTRTRECLTHPEYPRHEDQAETWRASSCLLTLQMNRWDEQPGGTLIDRNLMLKLGIEDVESENFDGSAIAAHMFLDRDEATDLLSRLTRFVAKFDEPDSEQLAVR